MVTPIGLLFICYLLRTIVADSRLGAVVSKGNFLCVISANMQSVTVLWQSIKMVALGYCSPSLCTLVCVWCVC